MFIKTGIKVTIRMYTEVYLNEPGTILYLEAIGDKGRNAYGKTTISTKYRRLGNYFGENGCISSYNKLLW